MEAPSWGKVSVTGGVPYLQTLLEAGGLVLGVLCYGGMGATALTGPCLTFPTGVPVLISRLLHLSPHLHCLIGISFHQ